MNNGWTVKNTAAPSLPGKTKHSKKKDGNADFLQLVQNAAGEVTIKATNPASPIMPDQKQNRHEKSVKKKQGTADNLELTAAKGNASPASSFKTTPSNSAQQKMRSEKLAASSSNAVLNSNEGHFSRAQGKQATAVQIIDHSIASNNIDHGLTLMDGKENSPVTDSSSSRLPQQALQIRTSEEKYGDSVLSTGDQLQTTQADFNRLLLSRNKQVQAAQPAPNMPRSQVKNEEIATRLPITSGQKMEGPINEPSLPVRSQAAASTPIMELSAGQLLQTSQWQGRGAEEKVSPPAASGQDAASVTNKSPLPVQSQAAASTPIMELSAGQLLQTSQWQGRSVEEKTRTPLVTGRDTAGVTNKSSLPVQSQAAASTPIMELSAGQLLQTSQWQGRGAEEKTSPPAAFAHEDVDTDASGKQAVLSSATKLGRDQFSDSAASIQNTIAGHQMNRIALWHDYQVAAQDAPSVPEQVADQMTKWLNHSSLQLGENGIKSMTMTLYPENLGTVTIMVTQDHTGITASLSADTQSAKDILKSGIEQLQKSLISQGLPIHQIDVAHKNEPAQQNQSSSNPDQAQQQARQGSQGEQEQQRSQDQKRYSASRSDLTEEKQDFHQLIIERSV